MIVHLALALFAGAPQTPGRDPSSAPAPPSQPAQGPGGASYGHAAVRKTLVSGDKTPVGDDVRAFWLFEPDEPRPDEAPVIVFLHGFGATNPRTYGAWIDHLVRQGNVVVYPRFQRSLLPRPATFTGNAIEATRNALALLTGEEHVAADRAHFALVGHSVGAVLAVNLAARAEVEGLPRPGAVFAVQPGAAEAGLGEVAFEDLSGIPVGTLVLSLTGDADTISGDADAKRIYNETTRVAAEDKDLLTMASDSHGQPALRANHLAPLALDDRYDEDASYDQSGARRVVDALDFYGTWKLFDGLLAAAFHGEAREYALGGTTQQRFMGHWSDGKPVSELAVHPKRQASTGGEE